MAQSKLNRAKIIEHVLAETASGRFISRILAEDKEMPSQQTWWRWINEDEALDEKVVQARARGVEALLDQCGEIADGVVADRDHVAKAKLRVETRIKLAQMLKPKTYGPKLDVTSDGKAIGLSDAMRAAEKRLGGTDGND